jgi:hypothetical protein
MEELARLLSDDGICTEKDKLMVQQALERLKKRGLLDYTITKIVDSGEDILSVQLSQDIIQNHSSVVH